MDKEIEINGVKYRKVQEEKEVEQTNKFVYSYSDIIVIKGKDIMLQSYNRCINDKIENSIIIDNHNRELYDTPARFEEVDNKDLKVGDVFYFDDDNNTIADFNLVQKINEDEDVVILFIDDDEEIEASRIWHDNSSKIMRAIRE